MRKVGNVTSNKIYNPSGKKPPVPIDADEADGAMERYVRAKYITSGLNSASRRHNTGSTESDETPPPLPPKTPSRFGFRSASSIFPLGSKAKREAAARGPPSPRDLPQRSPNSSIRNKASNFFGAAVQQNDGANMDKKLDYLRDMGFADEQRNAMVLRGVNGNLDMAIESLVRLGEGTAKRSRSPLPSPRESSTPVSRSLTPAGNSSGLSIPSQQQTRPKSPSNNPWDMLDMPPAPAQPQSSQSTGTLQNRNPYLTTNPFGVPPAQVNDAFNNAFQTMSLAPAQQQSQQQQLFPHHTGGIAASQPAQPFQQPLTPPLPAMPQNFAAMAFNSNQTYPQPAQPAQAGYNPFLTEQVQSQPQPQGLALNTTALAGMGNNPFARSPTRIMSPTTLGQIPEQAPQNFYTASPQAQSPWGAPSPQQLPQPATNPFFAQQQQQQQQPLQMPQQYAMQPQMFQPQRADTASILALYNTPQVASQPAQVQSAQIPQPANNQDAVAAMFGQAPQQQYQPAQIQQSMAAAPAPEPPQPVRSFTAPLPSNPFAGSKNPFLGGGGAMAQPQQQQQQPVDSGAAGNRSRDSMMALGLDWSSGRHSPDAFASLSARH